MRPIIFSFAEWWNYSTGTYIHVFLQVNHFLLSFCNTALQDLSKWEEQNNSLTVKLSSDYIEFCTSNNDGRRIAQVKRSSYSITGELYPCLSIHDHKQEVVLTDFVFE